MAMRYVNDEEMTKRRCREAIDSEVQTFNACVRLGLRKSS